MGRKVARRFALIAGAIAIAMTVPVAGGVGTAAAATDDVRLTADVTYTVVPDQRVIHAEVAMVVTNVRAPTRSGGRVTNYYLNEFVGVLYREAANLTATAGGRPAAIERTPSADDDDLDLVRIRFSRNVFYNERESLRLTYDLPDTGPRGDGGIRVNPAMVWFWVQTGGHPDRSGLRVRVPASFETTVDGAAVTSTVADGMRTFEVRSEPNQASVVTVFGENTAALADRSVDVGGARFTVRAWPGDDEWTAFMTRQLTEGQPVLVRLIGQAWPVSATLEIRESAAPNREGYAGWYVEKSALIEIGDELDADLALHEVAHAWFNNELSEQRWIIEGLAEEFARRAVTEIGGTPASFPSVARSAPFAVALNDWTSPARNDPDARAKERYGYSASAALMRALADDVGIERFRQVLDVAFRRSNPYDAAGTLTLPGPTDWRRFLDALEQRGGSTKAEALLREWVLTDAQASSLGLRTSARAAYGALAERGAGWLVPAGARDAMARWRFEDAQRVMTNATAVLDKRDALERDAAGAGLDVPEGPKALYETAMTADFSLAHGVLDRQRGAFEEVRRARETVAAPRSWLDQIGLWGTDVGAELARAEQAFERDDMSGAVDLSGQVRQTLDAADDLGTARVRNASVAAGVVVMVAAVVVMGVRRRHRRRAQPPEPTSVSTEVDDSPQAASVSRPEPIGRAGTG